MKVKIQKFINNINYYIEEPFNFIIKINTNIMTLDLFRLENNLLDDYEICDVNDSWVRECYEVLLAQEQVYELKKDLLTKYIK